MEKHYIYKLTSPSGKVYIGRTNNFKQRMITHEYSARHGEKRPLYDAIRKHGWENFEKEIIATVRSKELAAETELYYIKHFNTFNEGYNLTEETTSGGDNWEGRRNTKEYSDFISKMVELNNKPIRMHGKHHSPESIAKQKAAAVGRYSLDWFTAKYGSVDGPIKYEERRLFLKNRNLKKDSNGRFIPQQ